MFVMSEFIKYSKLYIKNKCELIESKNGIIHNT